MAMKYIYQMAVKYYKWPYNIETFSIPRRSQIFPNWDLGKKIFHLATLAALKLRREIKRELW
jgi:hypothetical protein